MTFLRLETFGGLSLTGSDGPVLLSQRRRLALLALLSVAGNRGMQRDKLLGYLWPESTPDSARHSLEQLVYGLRRELGQSLFVGSNPLTLNAAHISSDVGEFQTALDSGDLASAIQLYKGSFLDGFYLSDLLEFEEWTTIERQRLADAYASALEKLAEDARKESDFNRSVELWRKRVTLDNVSARGALGLMRALADAGDRAGALQHARVYELLVSQQLQSKPDRDVTAFAEELRRAPLAATDPVRTEQRKVEKPAAVSAPVPLVSTPSVATPRVPRGRRRRFAISLAGVFVIATVVAAFWMRSRPHATPSVSLDRNRVVVLPFRFTGSDSSLTYLAEGVMDLLAARLTGEGGPVAVDPRRAMSAWRRASGAAESGAAEDVALAVARDVGAGEALSGELVSMRDGQLAFTGRLVDARTGTALARATVIGGPDSLLAVVDQLAARLLAIRAGNDERTTASLTTTSLTALRAFLEGRAQSRRGHSDAAIKSFGRALEFDSTFALAAVDLARATGRLFQWNTINLDTVPRVRGIAFGRGRAGDADYGEQWARALEIGWRERARLSPRDRALLNAVRGHYPNPTDAQTVLANWEAAVRAAPDRAEAQFSLGDVLLYQGRAMGLSDSPARAAAAYRRALELDSGYLQPLGGLIEVAAFQRDTIGVRRLAALYFPRDSVSEEADYVRWRVATVTGDATATAIMRTRLNSLGVTMLDPVQWVSQVDGIGLDDGERAMRAIVERASDGVGRQVAFHRAKFFALNRGRPREAARIIRAKRELEPNSDLQHNFGIRDALWWDGDLAAAREGVREYDENLAAFERAAGLNRKDTRRSRNWLFSVSLWRVWNNDTTGAAQNIIRLRRSLPQNPHGVRPEQVDIQAEVLAGLLAMHRRKANDVAASLRLIDSTALTGCCSLPHFINLVSARLHESTGDRRGALAAVRRGRWLFPPEHLSTYLREEGRLAALVGDRQGAISAYRHYLRLRSDPEPSLKPQVAAVRAELAKLEGAR